MAITIEPDGGCPCRYDDPNDTALFALGPQQGWFFLGCMVDIRTSARKAWACDTCFTRYNGGAGASEQITCQKLPSGALAERFLADGEWKILLQ